MTIISVANSLIDERESAVKLARYAQILGVSEDQFFGINNPTTVTESCHPIWTLYERQTIARYLREAQEEIEQITNYPLTPRWILEEKQPYLFPLHARWCKVIEAGFRNTSTIQLGAAVSHATDPAVVTVATTITDTDEIHIFHTGTEREIYPSSIVATGAAATIQIPRARMVKLAYQNNDENGLTYSDVPPSATSPFESTVDVLRVYNDESTQGGLAWHHRESDTCDCGCSSACLTCGDYVINACIYVRNAETGALDLLPASYTSGVGWGATCATCYCTEPDSVRLNYRAGLETMTHQIEDAIIRLAHSKMPNPPCGCGTAQEYWTRDRDIPENLTIEQAGCPFGQSRGAWFAWRQAQMIRTQRGFAF